DMGSPVVNRIEAVKVMRTNQFAEDAGPMAHPIRPEKVIEMNNFYTVTVYDKGAEVIRMMHSLLGVENFRKGMDLYFERHDGTAVTCDDFVAAMEDASGVDLGQFRRWYSQSGTPRLNVNTQYDSANQRYTLNVEQVNDATVDQSEKQALHIPFDIELLDAQGQAIPLVIDGQAVGSVLDIRQTQNQFVFEQVKEAPVPVLLQNFSAPVKVAYDYQQSGLLHIIDNASNDFCRWDAAQTLYLNKINEFISDPEGFTLGDDTIEVFKALLNLSLDKTASLDKALVAQILTIPAFASIAGNFGIVPVDGIHQGLAAIKSALSSSLAEQLMACYQDNVTTVYDQSAQAIANRALKNACLKLLAHQPGEAVNAALATQFEQSDNMTDTLAVLAACQGANHPDFFTYMTTFEKQWREDMLVMDKWFGLHASWSKSDVFDTIETLYQHSAFNIENPNRVRAILGSFAALNSHQFHNISGQGYRTLTDMLIKLNTINPQIASRLLTPLLSFKQYDDTRQQLMREQLERLAALPDLSKDLFEKVAQSLSQS
ncbi:MAG: aminopeptidase N, partial [Phenylobacterium sp.]